ncbi:type I restriction enzyme endonuclease domain-containing protein [Bradyrhizobium sp. AUGA SZCCT0431]|uniref:type I restriction enzyme endonuclease domain-containing protein n=1 Tax=Bradyrhizobium sp. AUGA SZCCT0431 TaxID=2807674 RepID=UPI0024BFFC4D|nr:type I restriction enzyme endonuclease domain-containing protein [Bradyrhizobium sp. AUGA SZCCT0431]
MIEELISLAKDLQAARKRGEEQGLSEEELAFYDALAQNESAIQATLPRRVTPQVQSKRTLSD